LQTFWSPTTKAWNDEIGFCKLSGSFEVKIVDIELRLSGVWLLVTKKLPFRISESEMIQATFWNTNNGGNISFIILISLQMIISCNVVISLF